MALRGRPPGSKNKAPREVPPGQEPMADYRHADPDSLVSRQLGLIDWAQQSLRNQLKADGLRPGAQCTKTDVEMIEKLSGSLVRAIQALGKSSEIAEEMAARMSPEQLMEAALAKIEGQDLPTLNYAIRRLRAHRERLGPLGPGEKAELGEQTFAATDSIASLQDKP